MILFFAASCGKGEDGGKGIAVLSYFQNRSENDIKLIFFIKNVVKEVPVQKNETVLLSHFSSPPPGMASGPLPVQPFGHDSLQIEKNNVELHVFKSTNCIEDENPLCLENYEVIKDEEINEHGTKVTELKFVYK